MAIPAPLPRQVIDHPTPMTFEEFLDWSPDEGQSGWVDGWGTIYMSNSMLHMRLLEFVARLLGGYLEVRDLGECFTSTALMRLASRPAGRMPDLFVVLHVNRNRVHGRWLDGPADFVLEVLPDDSLRRDLEVKYREYEAARVPEYVIIDGREGKSLFRWHQLGPDGRYRLLQPDADGRYHSRNISGFWFDPRWLRQDPLPGVFALLRQMAPDAFARGRGPAIVNWHRRAIAINHHAHGRV